MADPTGGLPNGVDPSDAGVPNDSSFGADRAAAIEAEKKKWRDKTARAKKTEKPPATEPVDAEQDFDE